MAECMAMFSDLITTKFQQELAESTNYSSSFVDEGDFLKSEGIGNCTLHML